MKNLLNEPMDEKIIYVLSDIGSCAYWLEALYLVDENGVEMKKETYNALRALRGGDPFREELWLEGLKRGYRLKAIPREIDDLDEIGYITYDALVKQCADMPEDYDGVWVDCRIQRACFGKVIYG